VAREQHAKSWELRTANSYARLMKTQNRRAEALHLLQPGSDWFTEGFDSTDLKGANAVLNALA